MPLPSTYGVSTITYGVPTQTGFVVESSTISSKCNVVAEVFNETGQRVAARYDDLTNEITLDVMVTTGTVPTAGSTFTYNSIEYEVQAVDTKWSNKEFEKITIKGKNSANLTLS